MRPMVGSVNESVFFFQRQRSLDCIPPEQERIGKVVHLRCAILTVIVNQSWSGSNHHHQGAAHCPLVDTSGGSLRCHLLECGTAPVLTKKNTNGSPDTTKAWTNICIVVVLYRCSTDDVWHPDHRLVSSTNALSSVERNC